MRDAADDGRRQLTRSPAPRLITVVLAFVGMSSSFMQTLVIPIQTRLPELLGEAPEDTTWVVTISMLGMVLSTPIAGRVGDLYGKRRVLIVLLVLLVAGSVIAGLSQSLLPLVAGRFLQGVSAGSIPLGISILRDVLPERQLGPGIAVVSATLGIGGALGLPLSAVVSTSADWHTIFWLAAGLGAFALLLVLLVVPPSTLRAEGTFDFAGGFGLALGLTGVLLAITNGARWGWTSPTTLGVGIGGLIVLVLWAVFELRLKSPLVDLRVAARPAVLFTNLASIALGFSLFGSFVTLPHILAQEPYGGAGLGLTLLETGAVLMVHGVVMLIVSPITGRLINVVGARPLFIIGSLLLIVTYVLLLLLHSEIWHFLITQVTIGVGIGLTFASAPTLIMHSVPPTETAAANGLNTLMRSLGTTIAAAVAGMVLALARVELPDGTTAVGLDGYLVAFTLGICAAIAASVLAFLVPRKTGAYGRTALLDEDPEHGG